MQLKDIILRYVHMALYRRIECRLRLCVVYFDLPVSFLINETDTSQGPDTMTGLIKIFQKGKIKIREKHRKCMLSRYNTFRDE